jgi:hypothetical protein
MVQQPAVTSTSPWIHPDGLTDLLNYLRGQGYDITVHEYAAIQDLVVALIAHGKDVRDPAVIKACFAPVICTSPREQANFPSHFDRWSKKISSPVLIGRLDKQSAETEIELVGQSWRTWRWVLAGIAAVVMIAFAVFWWHSHVPSITEQSPATVAIATGVPPVNPLIPLAIILYAGIGLALTLVSSVLWWYYRGRLFLRRRTTSEEPDIASVNLAPGSVEHFERSVLKHATREFRRRYPVPSADLAFTQTVEETVRHCGSFTPVFSTRLVTPEYLALIDRRTFRDHSSRYADELLNYLISDQVQIERLYFDSDPRTLFRPSAGEPPLTLRDLSVKYREHRLLIFSDGSGFFDSVSGELNAAIESLWSWPSIGMFTPKAEESWGYAERVLANRAFIQPANLNSLLLFARHLNGSRFRASESPSIVSAYPAELEQRPNRWLERDCPEPALVQKVMQSLRWYLGDEGYFWLSACAVYPEIHFNLTMYLGNNLKDVTGKILLSAERLKALSRLPWLRQAYMPNWLRLALITNLSRQQNIQIREVLDRLWLAAVSGSSAAITIEIARRHRRAMTALARSVFYRLRSKSARDGPLRDHVFASVMLGRRLEPLAVRVPRMWRDLLKRRKESSFGRLVGTLFSPKATFEDIVRKPTWVLPTALIVVFSLLDAITLNSHFNWREYISHQIEKNSRASQLSAEQKEQQIEVSAKYSPIATYAFGLILPVVGLLVISLVLMGAYNLTAGVGVNFKTSLSIVSHALFPAAVVGTILYTIVLFLKPVGMFNLDNPVATNLAALFPDDAAKWLVALGKNVDLLEIWKLVLLAIGFAAVNPRKLKPGKSFVIVLSVFLVYVILRVGIAFAFS